MTIYETPGLCGLELWRGIAGGVPLYQLRERRPEYFQGLRKFLVDLHQGAATASDEKETELLKQAAGFERVVFCGGDALDPLLAATLRIEILPFAVELDDGGPYSARRGALRIFEQQGWRRGVALDLGQLQLKVMTARSTIMMPRDLSLLPFGATAINATLGRARLRTLLEDDLSQGLQVTTDPVEQPDGIVLALPVALDRGGVAEPATYPGLFGPVQDIFSGLFSCPCAVLNDAVLAGWGFPPEAGMKTLIVTLGFGVGGALWTGDSDPRLLLDEQTDQPTFALERP